ncbi:MAG: hypothetical protein LBF59_05065 [Prevotellaceae bacterium]|jgi:hypothetical protein|nr:hypothetical protein [Prevotellaceae bacterium]
MIKQCYFCDVSVVPILAVPKWKLYRTNILGMGHADFGELLVEDEFDDVIAFNSFDDVSYIAVRKGNKWGLIRLVGGENVLIRGEWNFKWEWLENMSCSSVEELMKKYKLNLKYY